MIFYGKSIFEVFRGCCVLSDVLVYPLSHPSCSRLNILFPAAVGRCKVRRSRVAGAHKSAGNMLIRNDLASWFLKIHQEESGAVLSLKMKYLSRLGYRATFDIDNLGILYCTVTAVHRGSSLIRVVTDEYKFIWLFTEEWLGD